MPLAGTFDVLDFAGILELLSARSATGRLLVRAGSTHGTIWLVGGQATSAEIGAPLPGGESRTRWRSVIEDICFDALKTPRGSFEFQPEEEAAVPAGQHVELEAVVAAGQKRLETWRELESVIHSFEAVPRLADALGDGSVTLSQDKWRVLVAIDGRHNVEALARRLDVELLEFCQLLKPLVETGAVVLEQPDGWLKSLPKVRLGANGREGEWPARLPQVERLATASSVVPPPTASSVVPPPTASSVVPPPTASPVDPPPAVPDDGGTVITIPDEKELEEMAAGPGPEDAKPPRRLLRHRNRDRSPNGSGAD